MSAERHALDAALDYSRIQEQQIERLQKALSEANRARHMANNRLREFERLATRDKMPRDETLATRDKMPRDETLNEACEDKAESY